MFTFLAVVVLLYQVEAAAVELLKNPDFESSNFNGNWYCNGCHLSHSTDSYQGHGSAKITQRSHNWAGLSQVIHVKPGHRYVFKAFIKFLSHTLPYHNVELMMSGSSSTDSSVHKFMSASVSPYVQQTSRWYEIGFDRDIPDGIDRVTLYIQINEKEVNYLIDGATFTELTPDNNWRTEAEARIEQIRKANVNIHVTNNHGLNTNGVTIELHQEKSKFAFGSMVRADYIANPSDLAVNDFFYDNFEWATIGNAFKWRLMEWTEGHPNFDKNMAALNKLISKGIKVRGHCLYWGVPGHMPAWLEHKTPDQMLQAMHTHMNDMLTHTRGKLQHWDVNNENLHGDYFEKKTGHPNVTLEMFQWLHGSEPGINLFLNDYSVLNAGRYTTALKEQARVFKEAGIPVYGIGEQSHFNYGHVDDMTTVKYRLDKTAEVGLPIWITELSVGQHDENIKAQQLEDLLTLYFSHPSVEGVMLWGFWQEIMSCKQCALVVGQNFHVNAAGKRLSQLLKHTWRTNVSQSLHIQTIRAFKGDYTMTIKQNGHILETKTFTLDNGNKTLNVHVSGSSHTVHTSTSIH